MHLCASLLTSCLGSRFTRLQSRSQSLRYPCPAKTLGTRLIHCTDALLNIGNLIPRNSMNRKPLRGMLTCMLRLENAKGRLPDSSYDATLVEKPHPNLNTCFYMIKLGTEL